MNCYAPGRELPPHSDKRSTHGPIILERAISADRNSSVPVGSPCWAEGRLPG